MPPGHSLNDILLIAAESLVGETVAVAEYANAPHTPADTSGGGQGPTRCTVLWKRHDGSESAPTVTDPGNHIIARMIAVQGCITTGDPWNVSSVSVQSAASLDLVIPGTTTTVAECLVMIFGASGLPDADGANFQSVVNADLTSLTEHVDDSAGAGNGGAIFAASGVKATAGTYGDSTVTSGTSSKSMGITLALKPPAGAPVEHQLGPVDLIGSATLVAEARVEKFLAAELAGSSSLAVASPTVEKFLSVDLTGASGLDLVLRAERFMAVELAGVSSLSSSLGAERFMAAELAGSADMAASIQRETFLVVSLEGSAAFEAVTSLEKFLSVELAGASDLSLELFAERFLPPIELAGNAALEIDLILGEMAAEHFITVDLTGDSALSAALGQEHIFGVSLAGSASLDARLEAEFRLAAALAGDADVSAGLTAEMFLPGLDLTGAADLSVNVGFEMFLTADLTGDAILSAILGAEKVLGAVGLEGTAELAVILAHSLPVAETLAESIAWWRNQVRKGVRKGLVIRAPNPAHKGEEGAERFARWLDKEL
jgi:hypothetical protein